MNALEVFKDYLLKQKTSKVTVKNYLSDIRKFIYWYENKYKETFHPLLINESVVKSFIDQPNEPENVLSVRSVKRYSSSLKKFFSLLTELGAIPGNPFVISPKSSKETDPWHLKEFRDYLYVSKIGSLTMKNYIMDINQFLLWLEKVSEETTGLSFEKKSEANQDIFSHIDNFSLQEYKNRLLHERQLSPVSINRKLSSLRRYTSWLASNEVIKKDIYVSDLSDKVLTKLVPAQIDEPASEDIQDLKELASVLPLAEKKSTPRSELLGTSSGYIAHHGETQSLPAIPSYSKFPPLRLLQKSKRAVIGLIDVLIILQAVRAIESTKYLLWAVKGKKIFAPTSKIIDPSFNEQPAMKIETTKLNKLQLLLAKLPKFSSLPIPNVTNFPKSMYAPLKLSTKHLPLHKRVIFHLRQTRPQWYKKYHSYPVVHYFHFAIFIIFATTIGLSTYRAFVEAPGSDKPVFAALPTAPPRILSFQGRLTDSTGTPITSATDLRFGIYNSPSASGSALLWEEVQKVTTNEDGVFATLLGKKSLISQALFANNSSLYLGIAVAKDAELKPRQQLATVAYASNAETLQGLAPITQANAGTANVILALDSSGNLTIGGSSTPKFEATGGEFTLSGRILTLKTTAGSNANVKIAPDGSGIVDIQKPIQNTTSNSSANGVAGAVEIGDLLSVVVSSSSQSAFTINQISTGSLINAQVDGAARFTVSNGGAGTFASDLTVNGSNFTSSASTFNLLTTPTTIYIGSSAATLTLGASSGTTTVGNALNVSGLATFNGSAVVPSGKTLTVSGNVASDLLPSASDTYSLGAGNNFWKNGYFTNLFMASTATTSGFWQRNNGAVAPANTSDDLLIGANTASSATFGISASTGNATTSGSLTFNTNGVIQTTKAQTLTLGGSTTGNIVIDSGSNVLELADNTISLTGSAPVISTSTTNAALELKANGIGTLTFNNGATGNIQFFSNSNTVSSGGNLTLAGNISLTGSNPSISTSSTNRLDLTANSATLSIGGTSGSVGIGTTSPLATLDVNGTASISGALKLYGTPIIQTTANQTLVLGGDTTGNITLSPLNGVLGAYVAPSTNNQIDIGTSFLAFKTIYVNNVIPGSIGIQGYLQRNSGALSPTNITDDLLLGSTATSSAKFAFLNVAGGTPTASISANSGDNATTLSGLGVLGTTNKQTLTLGNSSTGEVLLAPGGTTALTARGANLIGAGTFTSTGLITANAGLTVASGQSVTVTGFAQGAVLYTNGSAVIAQATGTSSQLLHGGTTPAFGAVALASEVSGILPTANGGSWWNSSSGALYTGNSTLDLLVGGTSTAAAKFGFLNVAGGTPTASISANSGNIATTLSGLGVLGTTNAQTLTLGSASTGDIAIAPAGSSALTVATGGNVGIGTTTPGFLLDVSKSQNTGTAIMAANANSGTGAFAELFSSNDRTQTGALRLITMGTGWTTVGAFTQDAGVLSADTGLSGGLSIMTRANAPIRFYTNGSGNERLRITESGSVGIGTIAPVAKLDVVGAGSATAPIASLSGSTTFAGFVIDNTGAGDLFTASKSGATKFTILNSGNIQFAGSTNFLGTLASAATAARTWTLPDATGTICISGSTCATSGTVGYWNQTTAGTIFPGNSTVDLLLGATATASAKFGFLNVAGGTPTASISANSGNNAVYLSGNGVLATVNNATLTIGSSTTGDVVLASGGVTAMTVNPSGFIGVGLANPSAKLTVYQGNILINNGGSDNGNFIDDYVPTVGNAVSLCYDNSNGLFGACPSDARFKENIRYMDGGGLDTVRQLKPVTFNWINGDGEDEIGFIAQDVLTVAPGAVVMHQDGYYGLRQQSVLPLAVQAIKEIDTKLTAVETKTTSLLAGFTISSEGNVTLEGKSLVDNLGNINNNIASVSASLSIDHDRLDTLTTTVGFMQSLIDNINAGLVQVQQVTTNSLSVTTDNITIGGQTINHYIEEIVSQILNTQLLTFNSSHLVSPTADINTVHTNLISPLASESAISVSLDDSKFTIHADKTATSAAVATIDNQGNARFAGDIEARQASFSGTLRAKKIIADEIEGLNIKTSTLSATYITNVTNIYNGISSPSATPTPTASGSGEFSASGSGSLSPNPPLNNNYANISSLSGLLGYVPTFNSDFGTFNQGLMVFGPSSLSDVSVTGQLSIGSNMFLTQNSINTIGTDLSIQSLRQGNISFMAGLINIDTDGNLNVGGNATFEKKVTVKGTLVAGLIAPVPDEDLIISLGGNGEVGSSLLVKNASGSAVLSINRFGDLIASGAGKFKTVAANALSIVRGAQADTSLTETVASGSAGLSVITANETERTIFSPYVNQDSLIYVTATSDTQGMIPYIARQTQENLQTNTKGSFTVQITSSTTQNIKFNWWIVN